MRITDKEIFAEENQGQVLIQTGGTTRVAIDGAGATTSLSATNASLTTPTISAFTASGASSLSSTTMTGPISGLSATNASFTTPTESAPTVTSITATSASIKGTILIGGAADVVAFYGGTPIAVQSITAATAAAAFVAGGATAATSASKWSGDNGTRTYGVNEIVSALKKYNLLTP